MYQLLANQYANNNNQYQNKENDDDDLHVKISPEPPIIINNEPKSVLVKNTESKHSHHHHHHNKRHISFDDSDIHKNSTLQNQVFEYENKKENIKENNESNIVIRPNKVPGLSPNEEYTLYIPTDYSQFDPHNLPRFVDYSYIDEIPAAGISTVPSESVKNLLYQYN